MKKSILKTILILILFPLLMIVSCSFNSDYMPAQSAVVYSYEFDNKYYKIGMILDYDTKTEENKKIVIHYGFVESHLFYLNKNDEYYNQEVTLKVTRHCYARYNSMETNEKYKDIYVKDGLLRDILNLDFTIQNNRLVDEVNVDDLVSEVGYKGYGRDYGDLIYEFSIISKNPKDGSNGYVFETGLINYPGYGSRIYYRIISDNEIVFLNPKEVNNENLKYIG